MPKARSPNGTCSTSLTPTRTSDLNMLAAKPVDATALRARVNQHIADVMGYAKGKVTEWDVLNEPYANKDLRSEYAGGETRGCHRPAGARQPAHCRRDGLCQRQGHRMGRAQRALRQQGPQI